MENFDEFDTDASQLERADFLRKNGAGFLDAIIVIFVHYCCQILNLFLFNEPIQIHIIVSVLIVFFLYRLISILTINKTIGMFIIGIEFAKDDETQLRLIEKLLVIVLIYTNGVDCFIKK